MDMHQLINIFSDIDDFCNELEHHCQNYMLMMQFDELLRSHDFWGTLFFEDKRRDFKST